MIDSISTNLCFSFPRLYEEIQTDINSFLDRDLKHHSESRQGRTRLEVMAEKLFFLFCRDSEYEDRKESWDVEVENLREEYEELFSFFLNSDLQRNYVNTQESLKVEKKIKKLQKENENLRRVNGVLEKELASFSSKNLVLEREIEVMGNTRIWRLAEKLRRACGYKKT